MNMISIYFYKDDAYCVYLIINEFTCNFIQTDLFQINLNIAYKNTIIIVQKDLWLNYNLILSDKVFSYTIRKDNLLLLNKDSIIEFILELNLLYENRHRTYKIINTDHGDIDTYYIIRNLISIINLNLYEN